LLPHMHSYQQQDLSLQTLAVLNQQETHTCHTVAMPHHLQNFKHNIYPFHSYL
jgi:hypothetical protein